MPPPPGSAANSACKTIEAGRMDRGRVVHTGWLRKSPPEKKLRLCAWRKRWFILRGGQQGGDPGVLEYYKHDQSKKPLRIISLDLCEQVHANVTFHKKGLPGGFMFLIKTSERTFYLVAETKEDMHEWVQSICQVCGFQQEVESTGSLRTISSACQEPCSSRAQLNCSLQQQLQEQRCSTLPHCSQPSLLTYSPPVGEEAQLTWSSRALQQHLHPYLHLHQCMSHGAESARSDNFSEDSRALFLVRSDMATHKFAQGDGPCLPRIHGQAHSLCIPSKPRWHSSGFGQRSCSFPQHVASRSHTTGSPTNSKSDSKDPYIFMAPIKTPRSAFQIPKTTMVDKSTVAVATPGNKAMATTCHPHKPGQVETPQQSCPSQDPVVKKKERSVSFSVTMPCKRDNQAVDSSHHHQASFPEACKHNSWGTKHAGPSAESRSLGASFHQAAERDVGHLDEAGSGDEYVPMSTFPSILLAMEGPGGNAHDIHNPRSPGSPHFGPLSCPPAALPSHKGLVRRSEIQPPAVDRSLKPGRKAKPAALDTCGSILGQPSSQSPRPISCTEVSSFCQDLCPTTESTTSLEPGHSEGMLIIAQSPGAAPALCVTGSPAPEKSPVIVKCVALDFQPSDPSASHKPSRSSDASEEDNYIEMY